MNSLLQIIVTFLNVHSYKLWYLVLLFICTIPVWVIFTYYSFIYLNWHCINLKKCIILFLNTKSFDDDNKQLFKRLLIILPINILCCIIGSLALITLFNEVCNILKDILS